MTFQLNGHSRWWCPSLDTSGNGTTTLTELTTFGGSGTLTGMDAATDWVTDTAEGGTRALDFDGTNDEVLISSIFSAMPFSVSLWAYCRQNTLNQSVFGIGNASTDVPLFSIQFRGNIAGDPVIAQMRGIDDLITSFATSNGGYSINTWHHILAIFRSTTYRQIYLDGVPGTADTTAHTAEVLNRMAIGSLPRTTSILFFNGLVDDVRIFPGEPSQATITKLASRRAYQEVAAGFTGIRGTTRTLGT
jgi:hypothetical protein